MIIVNSKISSMSPKNNTKRTQYLIQNQLIKISTTRDHPLFNPNLPVPQFSRESTAGNESSSLEDFTPIDSRRLQSGPHIALEVENLNDPDNEDLNPRREASAAWKTSPLIYSQARVHIQVLDSINYRKPKQNKTKIRSESVSSADHGYTETESEREDSEDSEDEESQNKNKENSDKRSSEAKREEHTKTDDQATMDPHLIQSLTEALHRIGQQQQTSIVVPEAVKIQNLSVI